MWIWRAIVSLQERPDGSSEDVDIHLDDVGGLLETGRGLLAKAVSLETTSWSVQCESGVQIPGLLYERGNATESVKPLLCVEGVIGFANRV
jgi:hypothetical protein